VLDDEGRERIEAAYREFGPQLWRVIYVFVGGRRDLTDEAVAEAFAQAARSLGNIRDLRAWLYRAAFKIAAGELKQQPLPLSDTPTSAETGVAEILDLASQLTLSQRRAFILRDVLGFSGREAARMMGTSEVGVRVHLHGARRRLRAQLEGLSP
jgi:RNA polymerase sigma-70 factor, ECF subfamily